VILVTHLKDGIKIQKSFPLNRTLRCWHALYTTELLLKKASAPNILLKVITAIVRV